MNAWRDAYFKRLEVLGYSSETLGSHQWRLKAFLEYLESVGVREPKQITTAHIRNYQTHLFERLNRQGKMDQVSSRNNMLKVAKKFVRFLFDEEVIDEDPGEGLEYAIEPKRLPRYVLTEVEVRRLLEAPDLSTALGYRDRTILEVFYSCGIRRSELINLRLNDVDIDAGLLRVNAGKGNKDRMVPLGRIAGKFLKNYIKDVRPHLVKDPNDDHIFLSLLGRKICKCMLGLRLKGYLKTAGIDKKVSIHTLRATCATHCLRGKKRGEQMHPRYLMELLGHSSMESLNPYLAVSIADLKEAHNRCHPRERDKRAV
jgi:integrase/recombinase XerD